MQGAPSFIVDIKFLKQQCYPLLQFSLLLYKIIPIEIDSMKFLLSLQADFQYFHTQLSYSPPTFLPQCIYYENQTTAPTI
jgi:uncharacterized membrane protein